MRSFTSDPTDRTVTIKLTDLLPRSRGVLGILQQFEMSVGNHPFVGEKLKVHDLLPILAADQNDRNLLHAARLPERQHLEQFVEGAEPAREDDQRLRTQHEVKLPHREVAKLKTQLGTDIRVGDLLGRQCDVEPIDLAPTS